MKRFIATIAAIAWPATELRTVAIEHTLNLPGGWTNVGFFRLSFGP